MEKAKTIKVPKVDIKKFALFGESGSGIKTDDLEDFLWYIIEAVQQAELDGATEFHLIQETFVGDEAEDDE